MSVARLGGAVVLAVLVQACGGQDSGAASRPSHLSAQACLDMANAVAVAAERACGQDYQTNYDGFVQSAANGNCQNIIQVRDESSLRSECMPWLAAATCAELSDPAAFPAACKDQLLHS